MGLLQSVSGQVRCDGTTNTWSVYLTLVVCLFYILGFPQCSVLAAVAHDQDIVLLTPPEAFFTVTPGNSSFTTATNSDITLVSLRSDRSGGEVAPLKSDGSGGDVAHSLFLSRVTPPHWADAYSLPTDPLIPLNTTTTKLGKKHQFQQEDDYSRPTSPTDSDWSSGLGATGNAAPSVEKVSNTNEASFGRNGFGSNDSLNNSSSEPAWVREIGRPIIFPALLLMSWIFTSVALILHILVPDLRANMGQIFMCYILALWLKCILTPSSLFIMLCAPDFPIKKEVCTVIAFVSYMMSMAYRFWLNIMCFDIWRKVSHLIRLEHVRPVKLWCYQIYGWGMPAMFGLMALLIREFSSGRIIKPGFASHYSCWFDNDTGIHQFLYLNLPGGLLHVANLVFVVQTRNHCLQMQQTSIPDHQESNNNTHGRIHTTTNYINEFNLQFRILNFMVIIWVLWSISLAIHWATDMWYFKVIPGFLISLQGVIIFFIFILNKQKRHQVQRKFPFFKCDNCYKDNDRSLRHQSSSISETRSERRKKISVISVASLTSLLSYRSSFSPSEEVAKHIPVREVSSVSSASYNSAEGGSVNINLSINRGTILPPIEDTQSLCQIDDSSELTLDPSNFNLPRSISCTSYQPNTLMDENPITVPVSRTLDEQAESYVTYQHV